MIIIVLDVERFVKGGLCLHLQPLVVILTSKVTCGVQRIFFYRSVDEIYYMNFIFAHVNVSESPPSWRCILVS